MFGEIATELIPPVVWVIANRQPSNHSERCVLLFVHREAALMNGSAGLKAAVNALAVRSIRPNPIELKRLDSGPARITPRVAAGFNLDSSDS